MNRKGLDLALFVLGAVGLVLFVYLSLGDPALQEADAMDREQAVAAAAAILQKQGVDTSQLAVNAVLASETGVDGYLGRYDLRDEFRSIAPKRAPIAYWTVSYYSRSGEHRSHILKLDAVNGGLVAFRSFRMPDTKPVGDAQARQAAEQALRDVGADPSGWTLVSETPATEHNRQFVWEVPGWKVGDLKLRYEVDTTGAVANRVEYRYIVPQEFERWHAEQQQIGTILTTASLVFSFLMFALAVAFLFIVKQPKPYWAALWLTLTIFVLFFFANYNQLPIMQQTFLSNGVTGLEMLLGSAFAVVVVVILSTLVALATYPTLITGGMLVREVNPRLWTSWRDREWPQVVRRATRQGYLLAMAWLGFQAVFYWAGETYFGVWWENDFTMSPVNMAFPLLFPLLGWLAGIQEEVFYRLFGVTVLKRYLKSSLLAVLLPAMVWALGHSLYPIYPIYTRFIELTLFGAIIGYTFLYLGLEAVIFAHVIFDVIQMCMPLLFSGDLKQISAGLFFLLLPALVGFTISLLRPKSTRDSQPASSG